MWTVTEGIGISIDVVVVHVFFLSVTASIYGLQTERGEYCRLASVNEMGILLALKYLRYAFCISLNLPTNLATSTIIRSIVFPKSCGSQLNHLPLS